MDTLSRPRRQSFTVFHLAALSKDKFAAKMMHTVLRTREVKVKTKSGWYTREGMKKAGLSSTLAMLEMHFIFCVSRCLGNCYVSHSSAMIETLSCLLASCEEGDREAGCVLFGQAWSEQDTWPYKALRIAGAGTSPRCEIITKGEAGKN